MGLAVGCRSKAARHLHLHFGHAQSSLAGIVGEAHRRLVQEVQHGLFVLGQPLVQVVGIGFGGASALALGGGGIADCSSPPWVRMAGSACAGPCRRLRPRPFGLAAIDLVAGLLQQGFHQVCPAVVVGLDREGQFANQTAESSVLSVQKLAGP